MLRQHDPSRGEEVATTFLRGKAFALEAERAAAAGPGRDGDLNGLVEGRHAHLGAECGLVKRDRQIEPDVGALERENPVRRDGDGDQQIAGAPLPGHALATEPDLLAVGYPGGNLDFHVLAGR